MPTRRPTALAALALAAALAAPGGPAGPAPARAEQGELAWMAGAGGLWSRHERGDAAWKRAHLLAHGGVRYAVSDFWEVGGLLRAGLGLGGGPDAEAEAQALAEVRVVLDAVTWVPFLLAGAGVLVMADGPDAWAGLDDGPAVLPTVHLGAGVDWRPRRRWSVGLAIRYHVLPGDLDRAVGPFDVSLTWSLYRD